jgi:hypothetical protein
LRGYKAGGNWSEKNNGLGPDTGANVVVVDPANPSIAYLGTDDGVYNEKAESARSV